jgi:hypothetical protein
MSASRLVVALTSQTAPLEPSGVGLRRANHESQIFSDTSQTTRLLSSPKAGAGCTKQKFLVSSAESLKQPRQS